jgi:O-antigen/teichoic acid export membrane protein
LLEASNGLTIFFSVVPLAFIWRNVWSVVVAYVAGQAIRTMFSYALYPHFPHLNFNQSVFKKLFPFGRWMLGLQVLTKFRNYMDQILLGPLLGAESLGVFQVGSRFSAQLLGEFYNTLKKVMFPIYSKMQYDQSHLKRSYKSIFHLLSMIIAPTCAFQVLVARQLALLIFGTKWEPIIPIMRIMAVAGAGRILIGSSHAFFRGLGKPNYEFAMYLFYLLVLIPLILFLGTLYRVIGVATAVLVAEYLQIPLWFLLLKRAVDLDPRELGLLVIFPLIGTILAASAIFLIVNVFGDQGPLLQLLFSGIGGGVVYLLILVGGWYHFRWESVSYLTSNVELILGERQQFERLLNRLKGPA